MENASKALIIAGAILLAVLIIALGMLIFNQAKGAAGGINLDSQKITAYNGEFTSYFGDNVNGSQVRSLVEIVNTHNRANTSDASLIITINGTAYDTTKDDYKTSHYSAGKAYTVQGVFDAKSGYLTNIIINVN